jgi:hypothetical protein
MKKDTAKSTMLIISMGFLVLYLALDRQWAVYVSLAAGLTGIISPFLSRKIEWLWMKISKVLSYVVPNILLSIVFFVFLFPIALLYKLFNKDPLMLSRDRESYFIDTKPEVEKESLEKTW